MKNLCVKIALIAMSIVIVVMGFFIVTNRVIIVSDQVGLVVDSQVNSAIEELTYQWNEIYKSDFATNVGSDGYLEIVHTRVVEIDPSGNQEFFAKVDKGNEIRYIVEFSLLSDYYGSSPYYWDLDVYDSVIIYEDGTMSVPRSSTLRKYITYLFDPELLRSVVVDIKDYGSAFNQVINITSD